MTHSAVPLAAAHPLAGVQLDPEVLTAAPAELALSLRNAVTGPDAEPEAARYVIAHIAGQADLSPAAERALATATAHLQALIEAARNLEAAGLELAHELEAMPG